MPDSVTERCGSELQHLAKSATPAGLFHTPKDSIVGRLISVPASFGRVLNQLDPRQMQFVRRLNF